MKTGKKRPAPGTLFICGTGISVPDDLTIGTLLALRRCREVFYIHADHERLERALAGLCPGLKLTFLDADKTGHAARWRAIRSELDSGRDAAYLTYGNPLLFSEGTELAALCRAGGLPYKVLPALSALEGIFSELAERGLWKKGEGFCALRPKNLLRGGAWPSSHLLVIFCALEELDKYGPRLWAAIEKNYPARHPAWLAGLSPEGGPAAWTALSAGALRSAAAKIGHRMSLVLPARAAGRSR